MLSQVSAVVERFEDPALSNILKELDPPAEMAYLINLEAMCERYSCLPKDLLSEDAFYIRAFQAILKGKAEGMQSSGGAPSMTSKQLKKGLK